MVEFDVEADFISKEEAKELMLWVDNNEYNDKLFPKVSEAGPSDNRVTTRFAKESAFPDVAFRIQKRILDKYHYKDFVDIEPIGAGTGMIAIKVYPGDQGSFPHVDPKLKGRDAVRCNIVLQNAEVGGLLRIEGEVMSTPDRALHAYNVTKLLHHITPTEGSTCRYVWLFGVHMPWKAEDFSPILFNKSRREATANLCWEGFDKLLKHAKAFYPESPNPLDLLTLNYRGNWQELLDQVTKSS
jgi:hypothetical protein